MYVSKKFLMITLVVCLLSFLLVQPTIFAQTNTDILEKVLDNNEVRVGMMLIVPPLGYRNENNEPEGFDYEIAKRLADELGVKLTLVEVLASNRIPYLLSGRVDVVI